MPQLRVAGPKILTLPPTPPPPPHAHLPHPPAKEPLPSAPTHRPNWLLPPTNRPTDQPQVQVAPGPDEVNWPALWLNYKQRDFRSWVCKPLLVVLVLFPIGVFAGGLTQLDFLLCPRRQWVARGAGGGEGEGGVGGAAGLTLI